MSLYSLCCFFAQVTSGNDVVSFNTTATTTQVCYAWQLGGRRKNLIAPRKRCRFPQHGRNRAVFVLAELDGVLYRFVIELPTETIEYFQVGPDRARLCRAIARANHFQRFELLPLLFQDD